MLTDNELWSEIGALLQRAAGDYVLDNDDVHRTHSLMFHMVARVQGDAQEWDAYAQRACAEPLVIEEILAVPDEDYPLDPPGPRILRFTPPLILHLSREKSWLVGHEGPDDACRIGVVDINCNPGVSGGSIHELVADVARQWGRDYLRGLSVAAGLAQAADADDRALILGELERLRGRVQVVLPASV